MYQATKWVFVLTALGFLYGAIQGRPGHAALMLMSLIVFFVIHSEKDEE